MLGWCLGVVNREGDERSGNAVVGCDVDDLADGGRRVGGLDLKSEAGADELLAVVNGDGNDSESGLIGGRVDGEVPVRAQATDANVGGRNQERVGGGGKDAELFRGGFLVCDDENESWNDLILGNELI